MERVTIKAADGYKLCLHVFEVKEPKAYVQIIHGMEEHQERYEPLVERLNDAGYTVITSDLRGHGSTAPVLGYFGEERGYNSLLEDQIRISAYIRQRFAVERIILFSHSMGTIIARNLLQSQSGKYEKVILSGYPCTNPAIDFGIFLTEILRKSKGGRYRSKLVQKMAIGRFNNTIKDHKTEYDWISFNEENVKAFSEDPYCGHGFCISAFRDLFYLVKNMANVKGYHNVRMELPILAVRGEEDPCVGGNTGSANSMQVLQKAGFGCISTICYPGMRHEILNEKDNEKVYEDILNFIA